MKTSLTLITLLLISFNFVPVATAGGTYQQPADFVNEVFDNTAPKPSVLWLKKDLKEQLSDILDHPYRGMRVRYWRQTDKDAARTAWILEETGKEKLITTGIVVNKGRIERVKVLIFRESRGWEVRHDFFTDQFKDAELQNNTQLNKHIDNISGATLSVRAVRKLAQIALLLDKTVQQK
ncbi:MAG: FMN-binding protein [Proteobacteria bacterium]|nr:FMN-binding protein [Pseudomonadota bacterium]